MKHEDKEPIVFEQLALPRKEVPQFMGSHYRVYSDAENFIVIEAPNALEAMKISGMQKAFRIQRDIIMLHRIVDVSSMSNIMATHTDSQEEPIPAIQKPDLVELKPEVQDAAAVDMESMPLASSEVEQLLQSQETSAAS